MQLDPEKKVKRWAKRTERALKFIRRFGRMLTSIANVRASHGFLEAARAAKPVSVPNDMLEWRAVLANNYQQSYWSHQGGFEHEYVKRLERMDDGWYKDSLLHIQNVKRAEALAQKRQLEQLRDTLLSKNMEPKLGKYNIDDLVTKHDGPWGLGLVLVGTIVVAAADEAAAASLEGYAKTIRTPLESGDTSVGAAFTQHASSNLRAQFDGIEEALGALNKGTWNSVNLDRLAARGVPKRMWHLVIDGYPAPHAPTPPGDAGGSGYGSAGANDGAGGDPTGGAGGHRQY